MAAFSSPSHARLYTCTCRRDRCDCVGVDACGTIGLVRARTGHFPSLIKRAFYKQTHVTNSCTTLVHTAVHYRQRTGRGRGARSLPRPLGISRDRRGDRPPQTLQRRQGWRRVPRTMTRSANGFAQEVIGDHSSGQSTPELYRVINVATRLSPVEHSYHSKVLRPSPLWQGTLQRRTGFTYTHESRRL